MLSQVLTNDDSGLGLSTGKTAKKNIAGGAIVPRDPRNKNEDGKLT